MFKVGIYFLMVSFGASFGFTVIGRISILIGRFDDMIKFSQPQYYHATLWCLAIIIVFLFGYFYLLPVVKSIYQQLVSTD